MSGRRTRLVPMAMSPIMIKGLCGMIDLHNLSNLPSMGSHWVQNWRYHPRVHCKENPDHQFIDLRNCKSYYFVIICPRWLFNLALLM
jgi:hypothetical protein